ncbi:hypothetical protein SDC9_175431 [bioreactor metagenome]|uniref:Uncharacterized protein n=1 Tax=bioreactor metagenome TaxID=1076179 RepID=A0A645GM89_9ZZZZ
MFFIPTMYVLSLLWGTPISEAFITVKSTVYPSSFNVFRIIFIVLELSWLTKFFTFSNNTTLGCFSFKMRATSKKSVPLVS